MVNKEGLISADRKEISQTSGYNAGTAYGQEFQLTPIGVNKQTNFILFKVNSGVGSSTKNSFTPAIFGTNEPKLGQTLISLGGDLANSVSVGRVISLDQKDLKVGSTTTKYLTSINTDVATKDLVDGSPIFDLSGNLLGMKLSSDPLKSFTPISVLQKEIIELTQTSKTP